MSHILVTGGLGLIGKHLIYHIRKRSRDEVKIDIIDNMSSSIKDYINDDNILDKRVTTYYCDVMGALDSVSGPYSHIYHLAAPVGPVGVLSHAGHIAEEILGDMYGMAELALKHDAKLMYISTSEVYGQNPVFDQAEDIDKVVPANYTVRLEYGVAKLLGEIALANIARVRPLKHFVVRPFNIVGPGQNADLGFVLPRFIQQAIKNEPITVYGDGSSKRTFTHVTDIADAMILAMDSEYYGTCFNVGNPQNIITIGELARLVKDKTDSKSKIEFIDPTILHGKNFAEAWNKIPNISRAKSMLGWYPKHTLKHVIDETIRYEVGMINGIE